MHKIRSYHGTFVDAEEGGGINWNVRLRKHLDFSTAIVIATELPLWTSALNFNNTFYNTGASKIVKCIVQPHK